MLSSAWLFYGIFPELMRINIREIRQSEMRFHLESSADMRGKMVCGRLHHDLVVVRVLNRDIPSVLGKHFQRPAAVVWMEQNIPVSIATESGLGIQTIRQISTFDQCKTKPAVPQGITKSIQFTYSPH